MMFNLDEICNPTLSFEETCAKILAYQLERNATYRVFYQGIIERFGNISNLPFGTPFFPVEGFRDGIIYTEHPKQPDLIFKSSGTSASICSSHHVAWKEQYRTSIFKGMRCFYPVEDFVFLAYTPGYNQNPNSSLVWMLSELIASDSTRLSRFLSVGDPLDVALLDQISALGKRVMLFGAAFGLVDLAEKFPQKLPPESIVMETGGMKTWRKEMTRQEIHAVLAEGFALDPQCVHSEYGMTELLSQAYETGDGWFRTPPWMKTFVVNPSNPLEVVADGTEGLVAIIDLANWASCPFLLTGDRGIRKEDGSFRVLGRWSQYHLRGCNFLLEE